MTIEGGWNTATFGFVTTPCCFLGEADIYTKGRWCETWSLMLEWQVDKNPIVSVSVAIADF